ncbi:MAG: hypothetical protein PWQ18_11 [Clostridia bacterium]|nr:hypothetical protein [Clostridia bacterium]
MIMIDKEPADNAAPDYTFFTLQNDIYSYLRKKILAGALKPGERIVETEVASNLGISKSPVREAMRKLEADGLVIIKPRVGGFVVSLGEEDIKDIYEVRQAVEGFAVRLLARKGEQKERIVRDLNEILAQYEQAVKAGDFSQCNRIDTDLHLYLVKTSDNSRLIKMALTIYDQAYLLKNMASDIPGRKRQSLREHREIVRAIETEDYVAAQEALINHLEGLKENVLKKYREANNAFRKGGQ